MGRNYIAIHPAWKIAANTYVERFNRTARYEWLSQYYWENLDHVQRIATEWMWAYNHQRPHMALGGMTPIQRLARMP
jgi:putative transposase